MQLKTLGKFFKTWYPVLLMMVIIFIFSSFPATQSDEQSGLIVNTLTKVFPELGQVKPLVTIIRKSAHFIEYAFLGFFSARAFKLSGHNPFHSIWLSALYAAMDEFHQTFISGRSGEFRDILVDTFGAGFGASIYFLTHRKKVA
ncbi:MAG: VanZ family protein [Candidatus Saccharibacteria bacterium]|nr:VanZ family protein [Candidatus Saccharibacteria bacterium]